MSTFTATGSSNEYFKVRWSQVLDLVRNRKVFLSEGYAYVGQTDVISGVCQTFRSDLSQELTVSFCFKLFKYLIFFLIYFIFCLSNNIKKTFFMVYNSL